jgi:hypothetical protein
MSSISSLEFTVGLFKDEDGRFRSARRVIINVEILKSTRTALGDLVALTHARDGLEEKVPVSSLWNAPSDQVASLRNSQWALPGRRWKFVKLIEQSWEADIDGTMLFQPF